MSKLEMSTETCPRCGATCPAGWCGQCHAPIQATAVAPARTETPKAGTTCKKCGRCVWTTDVDKDGNCCFCPAAPKVPEKGKKDGQS